MTQPGYQAIFYSRVASSVTDNFGNRIVIKTQTQESLGFVPYSLRAASTG
jgi:hypothetical protein